MSRSMLLSGAIFLFSCMDGDLPDAYRLDRFRVLAVVADQPEVNPGDTVTLTPFLSDVTGEGRTIDVSVVACVDPGVGLGAVPTCEGSPTLVNIISNQPVTGLTPPMYTGPVSPSVNITLPPAEIIFANSSVEDQLNGVGYLVVFNFVLEDGSESSAFKVITASTRPIKNTNPAFVSDPVRSNDSVLNEIPANNSFLKANLTQSSIEEYEEIQLGETTLISERPFFSWFISEGDLSTGITDEVTPETLFEIVDEFTLPGFILVVVAQDGRGGTATFSLEF